MLLLMTALCIWLGLWLASARRQAEAVRKLQELGCQIVYRHEVDANGKRIPNPVQPGLKWLRNIFGDHAFLNVYSVDAEGLTDKELDLLGDLGTIESLHLRNNSDDGLAKIAGLTNLKSLEVTSRKLTDRGVAYIAKLRRLRDLRLYEGRVSDEGIKPLAELENLQSLLLAVTQVTSDGAAWLKQRLPNAKFDSPRPSQPEERELVQQLVKMGARFNADSNGWVKYLLLFGRDITDESLPTIEQLSHLTRGNSRHTSVQRRLSAFARGSSQIGSVFGHP
jgi:hypothetical protein